MADVSLDSQPGEEFGTWVRDALSHLYDAPYLQTHPLAMLVADGEEGPLQRAQKLRRLLLDAIQALRPAPGTPASSPDWRHYRLLELRYIEALSPREAMAELALSRSQFFREQAAILDTLTGALWRQLKDKVRARASDEPTSEEAAAPQSVQTALQRITTRASWDEVALADILTSLGRIIEPLAAERRVRLVMPDSGGSAMVIGDRVLVRQAILDALTWALERVGAGTLVLRFVAHSDAEGLEIIAQGVREAQSNEDMPAVCQQLLAAMGGKVNLAVEKEGWRIELLWPRREPILLAVDDNEDFFDLYRRYLGPYGWRVLGATGAEEARRLLREMRPTAILLDVLMPHEDGWELLLFIRDEPSLAKVPVIICSVLDQSPLASSLGAAGYLKKPVTQEALVAVLSRWYRRHPTQGTMSAI
ncbi:MAG: response regulator [Chloroflexi bacterium]|nr:response regulator [Chloroflexota bacterium]